MVIAPSDLKDLSTQSDTVLADRALGNTVSANSASSSAANDVEALRKQLAEIESLVPKVEHDDPIDWRQVIDTTNDAFLAVTTSGKILEWNVQAENLFGWSRRDAVGMQLQETLFLPSGEEDDRGGLQKIIVANQSGDRLELSATSRDGRILPVEVSVSTMLRGSSFVFNLFVHDISNRRELQVQLAHAQKLESIGQLSAGIAHEINTPTQYVGDNARFVQEALGDVLVVLAAYRNLSDAARAGEGVQEALAAADAAIEEADLDYLTVELCSAIDQSLEGIDRVTKIVRAMKEFSHPGATVKTPTDMNAAIKNTITVATNEWKYVADIETSFDESLPFVPCLPGDFNQVILNLIVNSSHSIAEVLGENACEKGKISLATYQEDNWAVIKITDSGTGVPDEIVNRIFDPFFTTKEVGVGSGQGLAIAHSVIVDKHEGTIAVENLPDSGACFTIRLPLETNNKESQ